MKKIFVFFIAVSLLFCGGLVYGAAPTATNTAIVPTDILTFTPTAASTDVLKRGQGQAVISPERVLVNSSGNTILLTYITGIRIGAFEPGYSTVVVTIPDNWSLPSINPRDNGYFSVFCFGGKIYNISVSGAKIIIKITGLISDGGVIKVTYGDKSQGGQGAIAQNSTGIAKFKIEVDPRGDAVEEITNSPIIEVVNEISQSEKSFVNQNFSKGILNSNDPPLPVCVDGQRTIIFASNRGMIDLRDFSIYTMDDTGGNLHKLTNNTRDTFPTFSPDGMNIVFQSYRVGGAQIYIMNADGSTQANISNSIYC